LAARGTIAKSNIEKKLLEVFGDDALVYDKKVIVWADDGGERVQIALSMTCPKNIYGNVDLASGADHDFTVDTTVTAPITAKPAEVTQEEQQNIADLIAALGL
jgi:hypothetical protein